MIEDSFATTFTTRGLTSLPNFRAYVRSFGALGLVPFSMETDATNGDEETARALRQLTRLKYGLRREEVETEISRTFKA